MISIQKRTCNVGRIWDVSCIVPCVGRYCAVTTDGLSKDGVWIVVMDVCWAATIGAEIGACQVCSLFNVPRGNGGLQHVQRDARQPTILLDNGRFWRRQIANLHINVTYNMLR